MDQKRRKELVRAYRDAPRPMGVFRVCCAATGRSLLQASPDLPSALNRQRAQLSLGGHPDKALQADWERYGAEGFVFEVLDSLAPKDDPAYDPASDLEALLEMWRDRLAQG